MLLDGVCENKKSQRCNNFDTAAANSSIDIEDSN